MKKWAVPSSFHGAERNDQCFPSNRTELHTQFVVHVEGHGSKKTMSVKVQRLRDFVNERLTAAAEEIFLLFERTIAEYEEEVSRCKEENKRKQQLLDSVLKPQVVLNRADENNPSINQDESGLSLEQENSDCPRIKEEQNLCIEWDQEEFTSFTSDLDYRETQPDSFYPGKYLQLDNKQTNHSSENDKNDWPHNWEPPIEEDLEADRKNNSKEKELDVNSTSENSCSKPKESSENSSLSEKSNTGKIIGRRPKHCSVCGKIFASKQDLQRHTSVHTGEKPYSCSVCGKRFTRKGSLRSHTAVHTGEKPFSCPVCKKTFSQKGNLNAHVALHSGDKPFSCSECDAKFPLKPTLLRHMRSHSGARPFSCPFCEKGFTRKEHLRTHLQTHTAS